MGGRADQVYGRCMRLDMGMRGFGGGKRTSKLKAEPPIKKLFSLGVIGKSSATGGQTLTEESMCAV
jgi:hypothetical protein